MTIQDLKAALSSLGFPVAYREFKNTSESPAPPPPFITYNFFISSDMVADNHNYVEIPNFQVELYTKYKDITTEKLLENKLKELRIPFLKSEAWIDSEKLHQILYEIQTIGG